MSQTQKDFLNDHSLKYIEMALRTDRIEKVKRADGHGKRTGECGDTVEFFLMCPQKRLTAVSFWAEGCINTNACCNTVAEMVEGKTVSEAWDITPGQVVDYLETLPGEDEHCAELAVGAFYLALSNLRFK